MCNSRRTLSTELAPQATYHDWMRTHEATPPSAEVLRLTPFVPRISRGAKKAGEFSKPLSVNA